MSIITLLNRIISTAVEIDMVGEYIKSQDTNTHTDTPKYQSVKVFLINIQF